MFLLVWNIFDDRLFLHWLKNLSILFLNHDIIPKFRIIVNLIFIDEIFLLKFFLHIPITLEILLVFFIRLIIVIDFVDNGFITFNSFFKINQSQILFFLGFKLTNWESINIINIFGKVNAIYITLYFIHDSIRATRETQPFQNCSPAWDSFGIFCV